MRALMNAWARHETWFQLGRLNLDAYDWPVPGSHEIAHEGEAAYIAYRDFLAAAILSFDGHALVLDELQRLVADIERRVPGGVGGPLRMDEPDDTHFHQQWANLFTPNPHWGGLSHETLGAYVRKYEVERPLRVLVWLRDLYETGTRDPSLRRFRDKSGRLKKGMMVTHISSGFKDFPALRSLLVHAYSSRLRNLVGHNDYQIRDDVLAALDGTWACTASEVFGRFQALSAAHNALVWLSSIAHQDTTELAARGVLGIGWIPDVTNPRLLVLQLAAFRQFDPTAEWLTAVSVTVNDNRVATIVSGARERTGPLLPELRPVLTRLAKVGGVACEVVGIVPCLHADDCEHHTYQLGQHRYCEFDVVHRGVVTINVQGIDNM
ncbi:MAG: hypothetical protein HEQ38_10130 [Gemmatimonas sp.]|nr:hypothetical protein [Gemmatimonas sp.]